MEEPPGLRLGEAVEMPRRRRRGRRRAWRWRKMEGGGLPFIGSGLASSLFLLVDAVAKQHTHDAH